MKQICGKDFVFSLSSLPGFFSFEQVCMKGLRDKVADGVDPSKLYEPQVHEQQINRQGTSLSVSRH